MNNDKRKDVIDSGKGLFVDTVINVGLETGAEMAKESITSLIGELAIDSAASFIPGLSGAVSGYKRARFEKNIKRLASELASRLEEININLENKTKEQKSRIDDLFNYVMDNVIDEQQEDKIEYIVNGFVNITAHDQISDDFVLTYYDVLRELRLVDISVLNLMSSLNFPGDSNETYLDVMQRHGISYDQYESVRTNLLRIGLLTTVSDINIVSDLKEISNAFKDLYKYLDKLSKPKSTLPKLKEPKLKSTEKLKISKFGRNFVDFFIKVREKNNTSNI